MGHNIDIYIYIYTIEEIHPLHIVNQVFVVR